MRRFKAALLAFIFSAVAAHGGWSVVSTQSEFSNGRLVEHRHLEIRSDNGEEATLELAVFSSKKATLRVLDDASVNSSLAEMMEHAHGIAGVNGGYFDPEYAPVGLLVSQGRVITPLRKARLLSGVVSVAGGRVRIQRTAEFSMKSKPSAAIQCGPFLVDHGQAISELNDERSARRTFVIASASDRAAVGYCSHVTLAQLADLLSSPLMNDFKTERALNLDGGSSSAFWFDGENGVVSVREQKTVRDYLAIVPK